MWGGTSKHWKIIKKPSPDIDRKAIKQRPKSLKQQIVYNSAFLSSPEHRNEFAIFVLSSNGKVKFVSHARPKQVWNFWMKIFIKEMTSRLSISESNFPPGRNSTTNLLIQSLQSMDKLKSFSIMKSQKLGVIQCFSICSLIDFHFIYHRHRLPLREWMACLVANKNSISHFS